MVDTKKLTAYVDGDVLLYQCGFAADAQVKAKFKEDNPGVSEEVVAEHLANTEYTSHALQNVKQSLNEFQSLFKEKPQLYLTGQGNFREHLATILPYKGNRDPTHKPKYYRDIKDYLIDFWDAQVIEGREADDAMGCAQYARWKTGNEDTVIVTIDKDLDNIPGYHYNWRKQELYYTDIETSDRLFWLQVLTGDRTDNIQGIHRVGPKAAEKILQDCSGWMDYYDAALRAYENAGLEYWGFYENASLLWIQREPDKNFDDQPYKFPGEHPPWE